jgi:hypothetical protein
VAQIGLLKRQIRDLTRANEGMRGEALAILDRIVTAMRLARQNRGRARAVLPPRAGSRRPRPAT